MVARLAGCRESGQRFYKSNAESELGVPEKII
jgi:hypothetical protein